MRRLPIYLLLDTSGSMSGEPIEAVKNGMQLLETTLKQDPYALETVHISVITFDASAQQVTPLTEVVQFQAPAIQAGGQTSLGRALALLADRIDAEVKKNTPTEKGDWKPMVFLMTDGEPTDDWFAGLQRLKQVKTGTIVACAAGMHANTNVLQQITECVVQLDSANADTIRSFFKWVTQSIAVSSQHVDANHDVGSLGDLPPPPPAINVIS
ncbi:VWA domain-containing protein [Klebsiella michiganensis]|uniref:vWA domain-containing protein n=1 Tax=Klebsiella TaxID=570 RepID=UPI0010467164|nr:MULTISPECIES: VWA domain-containing protein [Klebsiella]ELT9707212.1 VWA domain-containing protein [Klebsiella michiganensis]QHI89956.1 VWA domain-containing protein [Klebsiella sp. MPUS7]TCZ55862.1 VWA domain-containing protein [Klebsiella grimontii]